MLDISVLLLFTVNEAVHVMRDSLATLAACRHPRERKHLAWDLDF